MTEQQAITSRYYVMNMLSNLNSGFAPKKERHLQDNINRIDECLSKRKVKEFIGQWEVVWGPALVNSTATPHVTKTKKLDTRFITDHAMYMARSADGKEYFIGISGTNGLSKTNWVDEDINVREMVSWPFTNTEQKESPNSEIKVSAGAYKGFEALWGLKDLSKKENPALFDFLSEELQGKDCTITVGGHSLGGCLTPLLASALAVKLQNPSIKIQAYPTAGPTPGNAAFADHLVGVLAKYHAVINENDLIPQAWDFTGLEALRDAYDEWKFLDKNINTREKLVHRWLEWARHTAKPEINKYQREPSEQHLNFNVATWRNEGILNTKKGPGPLKNAIRAMRGVISGGEINGTLKSIHRIKARQQGYSLPRFNEFLWNFSRFFVQMGLQHVTAYSAATPKKGEPSPVTLSEDVRDELKACFQRPDFKKQEAGKGWLLIHGRNLLQLIANEVLQWLKYPDANSTLQDQTQEPAFESAVEPDSEEFKLQEQLDQIFELESEEAQEKALDALDIDLNLMPWNRNPFSF